MMSDVDLFRERIKKNSYFEFRDYYILSRHEKMDNNVRLVDLLLLDYYCRDANLTITWQIRHVFLFNTIADIDIWMQLLGCISTLPFLQKVIISDAETRLEGKTITLDNYSLCKINANNIFLGNALYSLMTQSISLSYLVAAGCGLTRADVKLIIHGTRLINSARRSYEYYVSLKAREYVERYEPVLNANERINFFSSIVSYRKLDDVNNLFFTYRTTLSVLTKSYNKSEKDMGFYLCDMSFQEVAKINRIITTSKSNLDKVTRIMFLDTSQSSDIHDTHLPEFVYLAKNLKSLSIFHSPFLLS